MKRCSCIFFALVIILFFSPLSFAGEVYKWVDEKGITHFTDSNVPHDEEVEVNDVLGSRNMRSSFQRQASNVLEIGILKVYQGFDNTTYIDFRLMNRSSNYIRCWQIDADIFNSSGKYLAYDTAADENLKPGEGMTDTMHFRGVSASEVNAWKPSIRFVTLELPGGEHVDATRYYTLKEVKPMSKQ